MALYLHMSKVCAMIMIETKMGIRTINVFYLCSLARMFYKFFPL
jgi:hypothetical protein